MSFGSYADNLFASHAHVCHKYSKYKRKCGIFKTKIPVPRKDTMWQGKEKEIKTKIKKKLRNNWKQMSNMAFTWKRRKI